jgi:hypothetical protein
MFFIGPSSVILWVSGITILKVHEFLYKKGWISPKPHDPAEMVANLLINSMAGVHYMGMQGRDFDNLPIFDAVGNATNAKRFTVDIDFDKKKMVKAQLDGSKISASEAMVLIWFATISSDHVKIHSLANWTAPCGGQGQIKNRFQDRMNGISLLYNYFGFTVFSKLCKFWYDCGWTTFGLSVSIISVFKAGLKEGIPRHSQMSELRNDSEIIAFIITMRQKFLRTFREHKNEFQEASLSPQSFILLIIL